MNFPLLRLGDRDRGRRAQTAKVVVGRMQTAERVAHRIKVVVGRMRIPGGGAEAAREWHVNPGHLVTFRGIPGGGRSSQKLM